MICYIIFILPLLFTTKNNPVNPIMGIAGIHKHILYFFCNEK